MPVLLGGLLPLCIGRTLELALVLLEGLLGAMSSLYEAYGFFESLALELEIGVGAAPPFFAGAKVLPKWVPRPVSVAGSGAANGLSMSAALYGCVRLLNHALGQTSLPRRMPDVP